MIDYSELSDYEINGYVMHHICGFKSFEFIDSKNQIRGENSSGTFTDTIVDDFCNNRSDAWPIISENKISIMWMTAEKEWCAWANGDLEEGAWGWGHVPDHHFCCESQLRAAMIVFLMIKDSEK